ncbi:MAG: hypothetical protein R3F53_23095 [Gammaproteobacteria bacterium]
MLQHADEIAAAGLGRNCWAEFSANIRALRRERILISHGEVDPGLVGIGAPLFDSGNRIVGSLIFIVDEARLSALGADWLKQQIGQAADRINDCMHVYPAKPGALSAGAGRFQACVGCGVIDAVICCCTSAI